MTYEVPTKHSPVVVKEDDTRDSSPQVEPPQSQNTIITDNHSYEL